MKKNFLESFIDKQVNYSGDFNKIEKNIIYNYNKENKKIGIPHKFKLCICIVAVLFLLLSTIIFFPKEVLGNAFNYYYVSFDNKTDEKIQRKYYQKGETITLPLLEKDGYYFLGWNDVTNNIFYSNEYLEVNSFIISNNVELQAEWLKIIYDFNGIDYKIMVDDKTKYDPFDDKYIKDDKTLKQAHQRLVEKEFNLKISYVEWDSFTDELDLVGQIKRRFIDLSYKKSNIFAAVLPNKIVNHLGVYQYVTTLSEEDKSFNNIKGYKNTTNFGEQYIYYNKTKIKELELEDPLIMWMRGEWTQSNFKSWIENAGEKLHDGEFVLDINYADYLLGIAAASGLSITNPIRKTVNINSKSVINIYSDMKEYYNNGLWSNRDPNELVSTNFLEGTTLLHSGYLYYLNNEKYFGTNLDFEIGVIPYPVSDNSNIIMTEPFIVDLISNTKLEYNKPIEVNGQILKTNNGDEIYGVNITQSNYKNRYLEGSIYDNNNCVTLFNFEYEEFTKEDLFNVILRLSQCELDYTETELFINYLKTNKLSDLNIDVILSTQAKEVVEEEIINQLDFNLKCITNTSANNLSKISHLIVVENQPPANMLRNLQNAYEKQMK